MTYEQAANSRSTISRRRAVREYALHGLDSEALDQDLGDADSYRICDVLRALGY